ncbi:MAG: DUF2306 domain-containing protein [Saprospiraceae bacterium]
MILTHDAFGVVHLWTAVAALLAGTLVLAMPKGSVLHKCIGYAYVASMVPMLITSFFIQRLYGGWGVFHVSSVVSSLTLAAGMLSVWFRRHIRPWKRLHWGFMYWSVIGLYAAFAAELMVRIPDTPFYAMVGVATAAVMVLGGLGFGLRIRVWEKL